MQEYYRNHAFISNCKKVQDHKSNAKNVITSVSAINIFTFSKTIDFAYELFEDDFFFQLSIVENDYLRIGVLPIPLRNQALDYIVKCKEEFKYHHKSNGKLVYESICKVEAYIRRTYFITQSPPESFDRFIEYLTLLDTRYNTDYKKVCKELAAFIDR